MLKGVLKDVLKDILKDVLKDVLKVSKKGSKKDVQKVLLKPKNHLSRIYMQWVCLLPTFNAPLVFLNKTSKICCASNNVSTKN